MAETAVSPEKGKEDIVVQYKNQDEVKAALLSDPKLAKEFLDDSNAFIEKYVAKEPVKEPEKEPEVPAAEPPKPEDEEVTIKFKKSQLGTYKPDADVIAKGMREKDTTIEFFKKNKNELETNLSRAQNETLSLKKQIEAFKAEQATKPAVAPVAAPDLNLDPLDPDYAKKLSDVLKSTIEANTQLRSEVAELKTKVEKDVTSVRDEFQAIRTDDTQRAAANNELNELDIVRKLNPDIFTSSRPIAVIEDEYVSAVKGMCAVAGIKEPIMDAQGRFTDVARQVFAKYHDETGKDLKAACDKQGVKLPDDFDDLKNTWEVKQLRDSYAVRDTSGQYKPIPFDEAVERFKAKSIDPQKIRMDALKEGHDAHAKAVQNRQQFAKETKVNEGAAPIDGSKLTIADVEPMLTSYYTLKRDGKLTETETAKLTQVLRAIPGMDDKILAELLKG